MFNRENVFNKSMMREVILLFVAVGLIGFSSGFTDNIWTNFYKVIGMQTQNRALLEVPREVPGLIQALIIAALSFLTIGRMGSVAMLIRAVGLLCVGLLTQKFNAAFISFAVIVSFGEHLFMPLRNTIGITVANHGYEGRVLGMMDAVTTVFAIIASLPILFLFNGSNIKDYRIFFAIAAVVTFAAGVALFLMRTHKGKETIAKPRIQFKKKYLLYYVISFISGMRKQIYMVFAPWLLVSTFNQTAQAMTLLNIIGSASVFFVNPYVGHLIDKHGEKKLLVTGGFVCIFIYILYAILCNGDKTNGIIILVLFALSFVDRMTLATLIGRDIFVKHTAETPDEIMPTLSLGISMDHIASVTAPLLNMFIWTTLGPQWVFGIGAAIGALFTGLCFLVPGKKPGMTLPSAPADELVTEV